MYVFLSTLFVCAFLTTQLTNVLDSVLSQNADMRVSVFSAITTPLQKTSTETEFFGVFCMIVIGTGFGYIVSSILEKQIYRDMFQIHAQMNTLTGQALKTIQSNIFVEPRNVFACGIFSIIGILLMICLSVVFTTLWIRKLNIRKQMRGAVYE